MTNEEIESCIQTLRFLENTFLDDHGIFLNDKHPDNIEKIITFLHESPCGEYVSKDAVMKCFKKWQPYMATRILGYEQELKELPSVTPQRTRWIPCSERLPERDVNVLTYHRDVAFDYQYVSWIDDYSGKWAGFIGNLSDEVLAWMPLPEDYKEAEK